MQRPWLFAAIASAAMIVGLPAADAAGSDSDMALFGKDPGKDKAFACYRRHYDAAHLAAHRKQNVRDMMVFVDSFVDTDMGRQYNVEVGVHFRKRRALFQVSGGCGAATDGKSALNCGVDCDGGRIDVSVKDANAILVSIPDGARTWDPDSEKEPPADARFGADDTLFRLDRVPLTTCLPLVSDEDKPLISQAK